MGREGSVDRDEESLRNGVVGGFEDGGRWASGLYS